jgi:hypothetical protein
VIEAELRRMLDPVERRARFEAWKESLHGLPLPPSEMKQPIYFFDRAGELHDIMDLSESCNPYAGGDYNGHCGGCTACLLMQHRHYEAGEAVSYAELVRRGERFRSYPIGVSADVCTQHDLHPLYQTCRRCGLAAEEAQNRAP